MAKNISMTVDETLEIDYSVEDFSSSTVSINSNPNGLSESYYSTDTYVFDPDGVGTYELDINGQIIKIEVSNIPKSSLEHRYRADSFSSSDGDVVGSWTDESGGVNLSATGDPVFKSSIIGSEPVVRYDGVDDTHSGSYPSTISQPNERIVFALFRSPTSGNNEYIIDGNSTNEQAIYKNVDDKRRAFAGDAVAGGEVDGKVHLFDVVFDSTNAVYRVDGTSVGSGNLGTNNLNGIMVGAKRDPSLYGAIDVAEILDYSKKLSSSERSEIESYASSRYGITV